MSSLQRDSSGKNPFDFAIKWGYNVEKYWFCRGNKGTVDYSGRK